MKRYFIYYTNVETNKEEVYLNNTSFNESEAIREIELLEKQQKRYEDIKFGRTRKDFRYEWTNEPKKHRWDET